MKKLTFGVLVAIGCSAHAATISKITHGSTANGLYEVVFKDAQTLPQAFSTRNPNTIVLDFTDTNSMIGKRDITIAENGIYDVDIIGSGKKTRAVINLASPMKYRVYRRGRDTVLAFNSVAASPAPVNVPNYASAGNGLFNSVSSSQTALPNVAANSASPQHIKINANPQPSAAKINIATREMPLTQQKVQTPSMSPRFTKKNSEVSVLSFGLPMSGPNVNVRQNGNKIVASIDGFYASKGDQRRMEVDSYKTAVKSVDIYRTAKGTDVVLTIKPNKAFEFSSYQNGNTYNIEVKEAKQDMSLQKAVDELQGFSPTKKYKGAPLSLNFQDIEVRAVLQIIAEFTNNNIVVSDAVSGNITLRLDNVPWDQALDIILKTKGLGMRENGSVIYIAPASELDNRELDALKVIQQRDELIPARTELIQIKYANAADLANIIEKSRQNSSDSRNYATSILSSKGSVSVDNRTNTLLVSDIPSKLQAVRDLVAKLDEPVRQVLIDARLVLTSDQFSRAIGSKFGLTFFNSSNSRLITGSGKADGAYQLGETLVNHVASGGKDTIVLPDIADRLGVNMPTAGPSYGLAILGADFLVDLELSALQTEGKAEIVSSPRVVTQDGKKARIASGQQIPYRTVSEKGTQVEFKNAELSMDVTPRIAPDNRVDMQLDIKKDSADYSRQTEGGVPINTNQLETNVLVDNGETIVLGGVYEQTQSLSTDKVPLLGDLPVIGNAFKKTKKDFNKDELLIFVTPRIIENRLADYDKFSNLRN